MDCTQRISLPVRIWIAAIAVLLIPESAAFSIDAPATSRPNIIFFFVDDMGWQDTSVPFHTEVTELNRIYRTPNMERLAAKGMLFRQAYACSVCSPSRVSLMTGANSARHGVTNWTLRAGRQADTDHPLVVAADWNLNGLSPDPQTPRAYHAVTLPALLRQNGYRTIHCGKAHFGAEGTPGEDPLNLGFDINIAGHAAGGPGSYLGKNNFSAAYRNGDRIWDVPGLEEFHGKDTYLTEALTQKAIDAMEQAIDDQTPFYLYMSHYAIHAPFEANERFASHYTDCELPALQQTYATMIESMDESLGQIMDFVDTRNIADNTIILFMSDNGQAPSAPANKPLRGHKLNAYEGGIRVPFIAHWPGVTKPGTINSSDYLIIEDIFPSILELAGMPVNDIPTMGIDGKSFVPMLQGETEVTSLRSLFWHYPNTYFAPPFSATRLGDWKLIYFHAEQKLELYNLRDDLSESRNLVDSEPETTRLLAEHLSNHLRDCAAPMTRSKETGKTIPYPDELLSR